MNKVPLITTSPAFKTGALALSALLMLTSVASAAVGTLNFENGNGNASFDQYTGIAGNGWAGAWGTVKNSASNGSSGGATGITSDVPLFSGGGNYLQAGMSTPAGLSGTPQWAYYREVDAGSIDLTNAVTYSFLFRPETSSSAANYYIYNRVGGASSGSDSSATWMIYSSGDTWRFANGNGTGSFTTVTTGISITAGVTYSFVVSSDPTTNTYIASISSSAGNFTSGTLDYRNQSNTEGAFLEFAIGDRDPANANDLYFSVDQIAVGSTSQIPEPGSIGLLLGCSGLAICLMRRQVRR